MAGLSTNKTAMPSGALALGVGMTSFLLAGAALALTREAGSVPAIWPLNAVVLVVLLRTPRSVWWSVVLALILGNTAARLVNGNDIQPSVFLSLANGVETLIAATFLNRRFPLRLSNWDGALRFIGVTILACVTSMTLAATVLSVLGSDQLFKASGLWFTAHWLGLLVFSPLVSIIAENGVFGILDRKRLGKTSLIFAALIAVMVATFWQTQYPLVFLAPMMMALVAFQLGLGAAAMACVIVAAIAIPMTFAGHGPIALVDADVTVRVLLLQAFLGSATLMTLVVGAAVLDRRERERIAVVVDQQNTLLKLAEDMAGVGTWSWDVVADRMTWSDQVYRIHGYEPGIEPPARQSVLERYHPDDAKTLADHVQRAVKEGCDYSLEARIFRPDGSERQVATRGACQRGPDGTVVALVGTFQDITEHVAAERFIHTLTDSLPMLVSYWDAGMRCRFANATHVEWFGKSPESMLGMTLPDFLGPELFAQDEQPIRAALNGQSQFFPGMLEKPSGEVGHTLVDLVPDIDSSGRVRGIYVLGSDVTALTQAQEALQETNALLQVARDQADAAVAVKAMFLANMSHEIRTPLTAIIGFTGLMASRSDLPEPVQMMVSRVTGASRALLAIVNDVLDFSKLEAGQVTINPEPVDVVSVAEDTLAMFGPQAEAKSLLLEIEATEIPDHVQVDPDRLRQILVNLIGNALKFTDEGRVRLRLGYDANEQTLRVRVEDTGAGMDEEQRARLFERFSQVDGSSTRRRDGTGLGLSISKGLIEAMGGEIGVDSTLGLGSAFHFYVDAPVAFPLAQIEAETTTPVSLYGVRVLVADDNPANRELTRALLQHFDAEVTEAADGAQAVALASRSPFDVILMDLRMPILGGQGALQRIRADGGANRDAPIFAFTADDVDTVDCGAGGFSGVIGKPIVAGNMVAAIIQATQLKSLKITP